MIMPEKTYLLWINVDRDSDICVGRLGKLKFKKGFYHLSKNKNIFWHIDYLLCADDVQIKEIWMSLKKEERQTAQSLHQKRFNFIKRFGSSACRCPSHLFFIKKDTAKLRDLLEKEGFSRRISKMGLNSHL